MARETAAQRKIRLEEEQQNKETEYNVVLDKFRAAYPATLAKLMEKICSIPTTESHFCFYNLDPYNGYVKFNEERLFICINFALLEPCYWDEGNSRFVYLPVNSHHALTDYIAYAEAAIRDEEKRVEHVNRVNSLRLSALSKLSDEEKQALNLG